MAMATTVLYENFNSVARELLGSANLTGGALLVDGRLLLADGTARPTGAVSFDPGGQGVPSFEVHFNLSMAQGGHVEFLYAAPPHAERSTPCIPRCADDPYCEPHAECTPTPVSLTDGLRIRLDASQPVHAVQVKLGQSTLIRRSLHRSLVAQATPLPVRISVRAGLLSLHHAGEELLTGLALPRWEVRFDPRWRIGVVGATAPGASSGAALVGTHAIDEFELRDVNAGGHARVNTIEFAVAVNAQQFSRDGTRFHYFPPPSISHLAPASGSSVGGTVVTVHGANFLPVGTHLLCSFAIGGRSADLVLNGTAWASRADVADATRDSDSVMRCRAPRANFHFPFEQASALSSSGGGRRLDGTLVEAGSGSDGAGSESDDAGSGSGELSSGDTGSGDLGSGSGEGDFELGNSTNATNVSVPSDPSALATVDVTLNGRQFAAVGPLFTYFGAPAVSTVSPACGPVRGGTLVSVMGYHLSHGSAYRCRFGDVGVVNASFIRQGLLSCLTPALAEGAMPLEVSLNAQDFTAQGRLFAAYQAPAVTALVPRSGPAAGSTLVRVYHGAGPGCDHRCAFGNGSQVVIFGGSNGDGATLCAAPSLAAIQDDTQRSGGGAAHTVEVTLNGQQYTVDAARQFDYFDPRVSALHPASGPMNASTQVVVLGRHFSARAERLLCAFGEAIVNATWRNDSALICESPAPVTNASGVPVEMSLNGREFSQDEVAFVYEPEPIVSAISPSLGPTLGGTIIALRGHAFNLRAAEGHIQCRFDVGPRTLFVDVLPVGAATPLPALDAIEVETVPPSPPSTPLSEGSWNNASNLSISVNGTQPGNTSIMNASNASLMHPPGSPPPSPSLPPLVPPSCPPRSPPRLPPPLVEELHNESNASLLVCVAPSMFDVSTHSSVRTWFDKLPDGTRLRGGARLERGVLKLAHTEATHQVDATGSWLVVPGVAQPPLQLFIANFTFLLGGSGESGLCLSYGPLLKDIDKSSATTALGRRSCSTRGLGVLFHISPTRCREEMPPSERRSTCPYTGVRVRLDGRLLVARPMGRYLADPSWATSSVSIVQRDDSGAAQLIIAYADDPPLEYVLPEGVWAPAAGWMFALSAWPAQAHTFRKAQTQSVDPITSNGKPLMATDAIAWVDAFELRSAAMVEHAAASVSIVLNPDTRLHPDGVFHSNTHRFDYYAPPVVHTLTPSTGPRVGSPYISVEAHRLDTFAARIELAKLDTRCRFGDTMVAASYISPDSGAAPLPVARFACFAPALAIPTHNASVDGEIGVLAGKEANLATALELPLSITLNGQQYHGGDSESGRARFAFHAPARIDSVAPPRGPELGGTLVWIHGVNLHHGQRNEYRCRFNGRTVAATYSSLDHAILCRTPAQPELAYNATSWSAEALDELFSAYREYISPEGGNVSAGSATMATRSAKKACTTILLSADDAAPSEPSLRVVYRPLNASHLIRCILAPADADATSVDVQVSLNSQDFTPAHSGTQRLFEYAIHPQPQLLEPPSGPALGGESVIVRGTNFSSGMAYTCRFGVTLVPASRLHADALRCMAPPAHTSGAADELTLDLTDPWVFARGAALGIDEYPLVPLAAVEEVAEYEPPPDLFVSGVRIIEAPATTTTAGVPFSGELRVELFDQYGTRYATDVERLVLSLIIDENATMAGTAAITAAPQEELLWCPDRLDWCPPTIARTHRGLATFRALELRDLGIGVRFEVLLTSQSALRVRTEATYTVSLGPPALLRFVTSPDDSNLQDTYFARQPVVEVTDMGGNRVRDGVHVVTLSLGQGAGYLRGPKRRYTRHGVATFDRLRLKAPGYDKVLLATSIGLADQLSPPFGVLPNGIPHDLRFVDSPSHAVLSDVVVGGEGIVRMEILDVYGRRVVEAPALTLAPYMSGSSHLRLEDICDALCRDFTYTVALRVELMESPDNPHLRGGVDSIVSAQGVAVAAAEGLVTYDALKLVLGERELSTRVRLHGEVISQREVTRLDENGTAVTSVETYHALAPAVTAPFAVMRAVDPAAMRFCEPGRQTEDHNAGVCDEYAPGLVLRAHESFVGPLLTFTELNGSEVLIFPDKFGVLPMSNGVVVRLSAVLPDGSAVDSDEDVLQGPTVGSSALVRSEPPFFVARQLVDFSREGLPPFYIDRGGTYRIAAASFGLTTALSPLTVTVIGTDLAELAIDALPTVPQPYGEALFGAAASSDGRLLSVSLYDAYGNRNTTSGIQVQLELSGLARFLENGWLTTALVRTTVDGVADFSDATIAPPPSFVDTDTVVQAIAVGPLVGGAMSGPPIGGWGVDPDYHLLNFQGKVVVELKGVDQPGEIVLMRLTAFDTTLCGSASDPVYQAGDYEHPPGSNQPLLYSKYRYDVLVTQTPRGPVGNFTILPPMPLSNAQVRQRDRENWPKPSPLEVGAYGLCYRREGSPTFKPQLGNIARFMVGNAAQRTVVSLSPEIIFPSVSVEIKITFAPGVAAYAGQGGQFLLAIRNSQQIEERNCSLVHSSEVQTVTAHHTFFSGQLTLGVNEYHLCMANASEVGVAPPTGSGGVWATNFSQQLLVRLTVINALNVGGGHNVGVFTDQDLALRASTAGVPAATRTSAIYMQPPRMPTRLELLGPLPGSVEVRGVPFAQQPVVRVITVGGSVFADASGKVKLAVFGQCSPTLSGQTEAELVDGVATFETVTLSTISCLGEDVRLRAAIADDGGGTAPVFGLRFASTELFRIKHGAPHRVVFATASNVADRSVALLRDDAATCIQTFSLGEASVSVVVRDAQGSPVPDYDVPIDIRLCDAPITAGEAPRCPAAYAALVGTVQMVPVDGHVLFNNFSVTNISAGFVLALYTPLLEVDYSEPFAACDAGLAQELVFVQQPSRDATAAVPLSTQPILLARDGFGNLVQAGPQLQVSVRVVQASYDTASFTALSSDADASLAAQLTGASTVSSSMGDPLGLDAWNTTIYTGHHAVFGDLALGTSGAWRLHASSPTIEKQVVSDVVRVNTGPPHSIRIDAPEAPLVTTVDAPLTPPLVVRFFDPSGNNITHENATAVVELLAVAEPGVNGDQLLGNATAIATFGVATFDNLRFNNASTLKRLTAVAYMLDAEGERSAQSLINATSELIRVLPGPVAQMSLRQQPQRVYGIAPTPPALALGEGEDPGEHSEAAAAAVAIAAQAANPADGLAVGDSAAPEGVGAADRIDVTAVLLDQFGNDACTSLMEASECTAAREEPLLAISLTLLHVDDVNYTTTPLAAATRTVTRRVAFVDGMLGARFEGVRIYRSGIDFAFNVSLLTLPVAVDWQGLPLQVDRLGAPLQSSQFDVLNRGTPAAMHFQASFEPVYMTGEAWARPPVLLLVDVHGSLCAQFSGQVRLTVDGTDATDFFAGWSAQGALYEVQNGTARVLDARIPPRAGVAVRRGVQLVAAELIGYDARLKSAYSGPFDVFDVGVSQQLAYHLAIDELTLLRTAVLPYAIVDSPLRHQPTLLLLDVNRSLVSEEQAAPVQLTLEVATHGAVHTQAASLPPLYGTTLVQSEGGVARFTDIGVGGVVRGARLRASSPGLVEALSEPFDVVTLDEPVALNMIGAPVGAVVQRDAPLTHPITVEVVSAGGARAVDAPTTLVHLCLRTVGHTLPCTFGAPNLLASETAFAGYPGGVAHFHNVTLTSAACAAIGAVDGTRLYFEAATEGLEPGRTPATTVTFPVGRAAQLAFLSTLRPAAPSTPPGTATAAAGSTISTSYASAISFLEGAPFPSQPVVAVLDAALSVVASHTGSVALLLEMIALDYTNVTTNATADEGEIDGDGEGMPPPLAPPSLPPLAPPSVNGTNSTTNATTGTAAAAATTTGPLGPPPQYTLVGSATADLVEGVASFSGLSVAFRRRYAGVPGPRRGVFRLVATCAGLRLATSASFAVLLPDVPYALAIAVPPSEYVLRGAPLAQPPVFAVVGLGGARLPVSTLVELQPAVPSASSSTAGEQPANAAGGMFAGHDSQLTEEGAPSALADHVEVLPRSWLNDVPGAATDENGTVTFDGLNVTQPGVIALLASSEGLRPVLSSPIAVLPRPALLDCPSDACQWASAASAGFGDAPPPNAHNRSSGSQPDGAATLRALEENLGRPILAVGTPDMDGCGLRNEGRAWRPRGGRQSRWLLLHFERPVFATGVAVYESHAYGSIQQLVLIDAAGGEHLIFDQKQGDVDDADCLHTPLIVTFAPAHERIVRLWVRVGSDLPPPSAPPPTATQLGALSAADLAAIAAGGEAGRDLQQLASEGQGAEQLAQIDAVALYSRAPLVGEGAPLTASVAAAGDARLSQGMVRLTPRLLRADDGAGHSGSLVVHIPSALALRSRRDGGSLVVNRTRHLRAKFDMRMEPALSATTADDAARGIDAPDEFARSRGRTDGFTGGLSAPDGLSFCYGELPVSGVLGEHGMGDGLCISFRQGRRRRRKDASHETRVVEAADERLVATVEARYNGHLLTRRPLPPSPPHALADTPTCDGVRLVEHAGSTPLFEPPECEPPPSPPPPLATAQWRLVIGAWQTATIEVGDSGLSLWLDEAPIFERVPVPQWVPREQWGLSFSARSGVARSAYSIANVRVARGAAVADAPVSLHVSTNGQQYTGAGSYHYHAHPAVSSLAPTTGPAGGGVALTLRGAALGGADTYRCRFAKDTDPAIETAASFDAAEDAVRCASPTRAELDKLSASWSPEQRSKYLPNATHRPALSLMLRLWRDGYEYLSRTPPHRFIMTPAPTYSGARPASGPVRGGTQIFVRGGNLGGGWRYECRFAARPNSATPASSFVHLPRRVAARRVDLVDSPLKAGAVVCTSPHSPHVSRSAIHADLDAYGTLHAQLSVSLNAADYDANASTPFEYYAPPGALSLSTTSGPALGGTPIVISGANLTGGTDRRCRFTPTVFGVISADAHLAAWELKSEVAATYVPPSDGDGGGGATGSLRCVTPALPERVARVTVEVSLNGQQFTHEQRPFDVMPRDGVSQSVPQRGVWGMPAGAFTFLPTAQQSLDDGKAIFEPGPKLIEAARQEGVPGGIPMAQFAPHADRIDRESPGAAVLRARVGSVASTPARERQAASTDGAKDMPAARDEVSAAAVSAVGVAASLGYRAEPSYGG